MFDLAAYLGMSVARVQAEISSLEFEEWKVYRRIVPDPDDIRVARLCYTMARLAGNKDLKVTDFMPIHARPTQSGKEIMAKVRSQLRVIGKALAKGGN